MVIYNLFTLFRHSRLNYLPKVKTRRNLRHRSNP
jgi:hypothetical protein